MTEVVVLPHDHSAAGVGRRVVAEVCAQAGVAEPVTEVAVLLVSELVTNAVVHAHSQPRLTATPQDGGVYVGVTDDSPDMPVVRGDDGAGVGGRGLLLVAALSTGWGIRSLGLGKEVWFTLSCEVPEQG